MKKIFPFLCLLTFAIVLASCTPLKRAQTGMARAIAGSDVIKVDGHEVYCSEGKVCSEVDVLAITILTETNTVRVTLKNRTGNSARVQIRLQIKDGKTGAVLTETRPEDVPLPPTQEVDYEVRYVYKENAVVRVIMNTPY